MKVFPKDIVLKFLSFVGKDVGAKTVFYHDVGRLYTEMGTDKGMFWRHMDCLRPGDVLCFDDGYRGIWDEREAFSKRGVQPIVFLALALVGRRGYLSWKEIFELQENYGFDFECHTWTHQTLAGPFIDEAPVPAKGRTESWYRHELVDSKLELERRLGKSISSLCFPAGHFSDDVVRRCVEAGYTVVYASFPGNASADFVQPRCLVQDLSPHGMKAVLNGGMNLLKKHYIRMHKYG